MSLGRSSETSFGGSGLDDGTRKLLFCVGIEEELEKSRLYDEREPPALRGLVCGELYRAMIRSPRENMSAAAVNELSKIKSGEV